MANQYKALFRGAASTGSTTLYTVPEKTTTMLTSIVITNTAGTAATYTLTLNGVSIAPAVPVPPNDSVQIEPKQVLEEGQILAGLASAVTVNFHVTGLEMT